MQLIRSIHNLSAKQAAFSNGSVVAIGNFDGVHLGHQQILNRLIEQARTLNLPTVVVLFEPQPKEFFAKNHHFSAPARLMRLRDKLHQFQQLQIDYVLCIRFSKSFADLSPNEFIQKILVNGLNLKYLSIGDDFRFGANRAGCFETLQQAGERFGFQVENSITHCLSETRISSSAVRDALGKDDLRLATQLLGNPYAIRGRVAHGNKLGRTIGFPTANIMLNRLVTPIQGVFAVEVETPNGLFQGIANVGNRPTINGTKPLLEVHLFDFAHQIYGKAIEVRFLKKIRSEIKFESFELLKQQIEKDVLAVKNYFASGQI